uniref:KH domain-containing protein n=1 Tax=Rhabditophanes sp. KR3021 TaxID=114890 RepID=A0AC35UG97_9BILA
MDSLGIDSSFVHGQKGTHNRSSPFVSHFETLTKLIKDSEKEISTYTLIKENAETLQTHLSALADVKGSSHSQSSSSSKKEMFLNFVEKQRHTRVGDDQMMIDGSPEVARFEHHSNERNQDGTMPHLPHILYQSSERAVGGDKRTLNNLQEAFFTPNEEQFHDLDANYFSPSMTYHDPNAKTPPFQKNLAKYYTDLPFPRQNDTPIGRYSINPEKDNFEPAFFAQRLDGNNSGNFQFDGHNNSGNDFNYHHTQGPHSAIIKHSTDKDTSYYNKNSSEYCFATKETAPPKIIYQHQSPPHQPPTSHGGDVYVVSAKLMLQEEPGISIIGKLIGPKGITIKALESETDCQMFVRGRGSIKDTTKQAQLQRLPGGSHFNLPLHVLIQTADPSSDVASNRLFVAIKKINEVLGHDQGTPHNIDHLIVSQMPYANFKSIKRSPLTKGYTQSYGKSSPTKQQYYVNAY